MEKGTTMQKMPDEDFGRAMGGAALSRRELLRMLGVSAGAVSLGGLMAACGSDDDDDDNDDLPTATSPAAGAPDPTATDASGGQTTSAGNQR
jgi:hypothetical protein